MADGTLISVRQCQPSLAPCLQIRRRDAADNTAQLSSWLSQQVVQVLLLLPMRHLARVAVMRLCQLAQQETRKDSIQGKARFLEEYADPPPEGALGAGLGSAGAGQLVALDLARPAQRQVCLADEKQVLLASACTLSGGRYDGDTHGGRSTCWTRST